jgi:hypothetical protein
VPTTPARVYVHIGPPKTGTTFLQAVLRRNRSRLADAGVKLPLDGELEHFLAALDLRGFDFKGHAHPSRPGAWPRLAKAVDVTPGAVTVISNELFAGAHSAEIARLVRDLAPAEVHVIYGARDIARQLPAAWQESVKNRGRRPWASYLDNALRLLDEGDIHRGFWRGQHQPSTLGRWAEHVSPERIHVVTLPQRGAPPDLLWQRFCAAMGIDAQGYDLDVERSNPSLSAEETEVLRLVNKALPEDVNWPTYQRRIKRLFNQRANRGRSSGTRLTVPREYQDRLVDHMAQVKKQLIEAGYGVVGSLDDLDPVEASFGPRIELQGPGISQAAAELLAEALMHPGRGPALQGSELRRRLRVSDLRHRLGPRLRSIMGRWR